MDDITWTLVSEPLKAKPKSQRVCYTCVAVDCWTEYGNEYSDCLLRTRDFKRLSHSEYEKKWGWADEIDPGYTTAYTFAETCPFYSDKAISIMKKTNKTYSLAEIRKLERNHYKVCGVVVDEELMSKEGMSFTIIDQGEDPMQLKSAEAWLRAQRDVVGPIYLARPEVCPICQRSERNCGGWSRQNKRIFCDMCGNSWRKNES